MVNATGWEQLMDGNMVASAFTMFNGAWNGYVIIILFFVFQIMLFLKTRSWGLLFTSGILFAGMLATSTYFNIYDFMNPKAIIILVTVLALELTGVLYASFVKA